MTNNSFIKVSTSARSGTAQILHISEYGIISVENPKLASEITSGALNSVHNNAYVFIESTSKGKRGKFYPMCMTSIKRTADAENGLRELTNLDYKFHFYPWYRNPADDLPEEQSSNVKLSADLDRYFMELEISHNIKLKHSQKIWYMIKRDEMKDEFLESNPDEYAAKEDVSDTDELMRMEFPSFWQECFDKKVLGSYFEKAISMARKENRIVGHSLFDSGRKVDTWWDLGSTDYTAIIFTQHLNGRCFIIDYYENSGEPLSFYLRYLDKLAREKRYLYGNIVFPHDGAHTELSSGISCRTKALELGYKVQIAPKAKNKIAYINHARVFIDRCNFGGNNVNILIEHLRGYAKKFNISQQVFEDKPRKSEHCHAADAFQILAANFIKLSSFREQYRNTPSTGYSNLYPTQRGAYDGIV